MGIATDCIFVYTFSWRMSHELFAHFPPKVGDPDAVMNEKGAHSPGFKVFREGVVETAHGTGTGSHSHERFGDFSTFMGAGSRDKHLRQPMCYLVLVPIGTLEDLRV